MLGPGGIGAKSSLIVQFIKNQFPEEYDPTIEDSYKKQFEVDGITYFGDFLDTAGQEEYASMRESWIRNSHGFLLGYSITSYPSFIETITSFYSEILRVKDTDWVPIVLVGNKCDLESERQVQKEQAMTWAKIKGFPFFETSALTRENIVEAIHTLVRLTHLNQITAENYIPYHHQKETEKNPK
uniref:Uncharacterized protein n=1 Tax=Arcella intermedia TaxID=1963864 RepID=A0A6B2LKX2_9EUKA